MMLPRNAHRPLIASAMQLSNPESLPMRQKFCRKNKGKVNWARASIPKDRHPGPVQFLPIDV